MTHSMIAGHEGWEPLGGGNTTEPTTAGGQLICIEFVANGKRGEALQRTALREIQELYYKLKLNGRIEREGQSTQG